MNKEEILKEIQIEGENGFQRRDQYLAYIAGATRALELVDDGWIEINKKNRPEIGKWVLLFNGHWRGVGKYQPNDGDHREPKWQDETSEYIEPYPTHFMELPSPPKTPNP